MIRYSNLGSALYAKEKLNGFEYPPGNRLVVHFLDDGEDRSRLAPPHRFCPKVGLRVCWGWSDCNYWVNMATSSGCPLHCKHERDWTVKVTLDPHRPAVGLVVLFLATCHVEVSLGKYLLLPLGGVKAPNQCKRAPECDGVHSHMFSNCRNNCCY